MSKVDAKYDVGDPVRVKERDRISEGLDESNKHESCLFMDQMWDYCEKDFKIMEVVHHYFDEYRYKMYEPKSPLYILEGLICHGKVESFDHKCDRSCYFLWHEDWLENI